MPHRGLIGNPVQIGSGPAAVIGDERRNATARQKPGGKARQVGWSESQKTCL